MMRQSLTWREKYGMDEAATNWKASEVLQKYFPQGFLGYDKEGRPVWILCYGRCDIKGLLDSESKENGTKYVCAIWERSKLLMAEQTKKLGKPVTQHVVIFDLQGFGFRHALWKPALDYLVMLTQTHEGNYPEILHRVFVINAPSVFNLAFAIMKPFLHENTANKIFIFTVDRSKWIPEILGIVDADVIPKHWGGTRTDPDGDPYCSSFIVMGGEVPKSYNRKNQANVPDKLLSNSVSIGKGESYRVEVDVKEAGSLIRWAFQTDNYDVGFSVFRFGTAGVEEEVVPYLRIESHLSIEEGELKCNTPGKYHLIFDNSYSMVRSKTLYYDLDLVAPTPGKDPNQNGFSTSEIMENSRM